jgi:hypothetical protein
MARRSDDGRAYRRKRCVVFIARFDRKSRDTIDTLHAQAIERAENDNALQQSEYLMHIATCRG